MIPLYWYLMVAAVLFCVGIFGVLSRRNAISILMSIELMMNASIINIIAFWRYNASHDISGQVFAAFVFVVAAAEAAVGLALIIAIYRNRRTVHAEELNLLKW